MHSLGIIDILCRGVIAEDDILRHAILVAHEEIGESSAIIDEGSIDPWRGNGILLINETRRGAVSILAQDSQ